MSGHLTFTSLVATYGTLILLKGEGPVSPKAREHFLSRKANFQIKTCWIVAQFLAHKPVNFAWLTDSFIGSFANYWSLNANTANINQLSGPEKFPSISRNGAQAPVTYMFVASGGCPLTRLFMVVPYKIIWPVVASRSRCCSPNRNHDHQHTCSLPYIRKKCSR